MTVKSSDVLAAMDAIKNTNEFINKVFIDIANREHTHKEEGERINADDVHWIVNDNGELGVEIFGRKFFLYKGDSYEYVGPNSSAKKYRPVAKREFDEVRISPKFEEDPEGFAADCELFLHPTINE